MPQTPACNGRWEGGEVSDNDAAGRTLVGGARPSRDRASLRFVFICYL